MLAKVIPFPGSYFNRKKYPPLTSRMIVSLLEAVKKQKNKTPFGPDTIKGSLTTLITRGLIVRKKITLMGHMESQWQVTEEAIGLLKNLGTKT
jgi:hypothetical protein